MSESRARSKWKGLIRVCISGGLLVWILSRYSLAEIADTVRGCDKRLILASFGIHVSALLVNGLRLGWLLRAQGLIAPVRSVLFVHMTSFFYNLASPGTVVGDVARVVSLPAKQGSRAAVAHTALIWRVTGSLSMSVLCVVGGVVLFIGQRDIRLLIIPIAFLLLTIGLLALLTWRAVYPWLTHLAGRSEILAGMLRDLGEAAGDYRKQPWRLAVSVAIAFAGHLLIILAWWVASRSLSLGIPLWPFIIVMPITGILRILPISIQGIGVRETVSVYLLGILGYEAPGALSVALVISSQFVLISVGGGLLSLLFGVGRFFAGEETHAG